MASREHPRYANFDWPDYEFREYPMMVYPGATDQKKPYGPDGKPLKGVIVNSAEEAAEALMGDEAPALVPTDSPGTSRLETEEDRKLSAIAQAEALGVQVDKRWGLAKIEAAIDEHVAAAG